MSEKLNTQTEQFENYEQAEAYIEHVREAYRNDEANYTGQRTEEQKIIAMVNDDEARMLVDGALMGLLSMRLHGTMASNLGRIDTESKEPVIGGLSWSKYRGEFSRLLVGFGVITNRMERDNPDFVSYANMHAKDRMQIASALFSDYNRHNALRFGVETAGIPKTELIRTHTEDGEIEVTKHTYDKDKARTRKELVSNMADRGFTLEKPTHQAGKISPDDYIELRRDFPEMDKDDFDNAVNNFEDVRKELEKRNS